MIIDIITLMTPNVDSILLRPLAFATLVYAENRIFMAFSVLIAIVAIAEMVDKMASMLGAAARGIPETEFNNAWMFKSLFNTRVTNRLGEVKAYHTYKELTTKAMIINIIKFLFNRPIHESVQVQKPVVVSEVEMTEIELLQQTQVDSYV